MLLGRLEPFTLLVVLAPAGMLAQVRAFAVQKMAATSAVAERSRTVSTSLFTTVSEILCPSPGPR